MPPFSLNQVTTYRWSLVDDVMHYRECGYEAIGLWYPKILDYGEERTWELFQEMRMAISSISFAGGFTGANGHSFEEAVAEGKELIRIAKLLRAQTVVLVSGSRGSHTPKHALDILYDALTELADLAGEAEIQLALQPMHPMFAYEWTFLNTLDEALAVLDELNHPALKLAFGTYHLWQETNLLQRIPSLVEDVGILLVSDWRQPPRSLHDRCLPGEGIIPLRNILSAFLSAGYQGFIEADIWSEELWNKETRYEELILDLREQLQLLCGSGADFPLQH